MQELITAYADGELQGADRQATEKHLADCALCAGVLASVTAMKSVMKADALMFNAPGSLLKRIDTLIEKTIDPAAVPGTVLIAVSDQASNSPNFGAGGAGIWRYTPPRSQSTASRPGST